MSRPSLTLLVALAVGLVLPLGRIGQADPLAGQATTAATPAPVLPRIDSQARLERWIKRWPNMRLGHPHEVWAEDATVSFPMRTRAQCLEELRTLNVTVTPADPSPLVPLAVTLRSGEIDGVRFQDGHGAALTYGCDMMSRVVKFAAVAKELGIARVIVASGYRDHPRVSFHTLGLAMDVSRFVLSDGSDLRVLRDYERTPDRPTCEGSPTSPKAQLLQKIACTLHERRVFSSVLTPNYNVGHHDHLHVDWRPGDARFYVR